MRKKLEKPVVSRSPQKKRALLGETSNQSALRVLMKFRSIINTSRRHYKWIEGQCGINGAQLWVLAEVHQAQGLRVNDIAGLMAMNQSTVSNLIDKLESKSLVKRERSSEDRRVVTLFITPSGVATLSRAPRPARGLLQEALFALPENSLASLDHILEEVLLGMGAVGTTSMNTPLAEILSTK